MSTDRCPKCAAGLVQSSHFPAAEFYSCGTYRMVHDGELYESGICKMGMELKNMHDEHVRLKEEMLELQFRLSRSLLQSVTERNTGEKND